jgi:hypothetical protein
MTKRTKKSESKAGKSPSHIVWFVPERDNAPWVRVGAQWVTKQGNGFNMVLDLVPIVSGHFVVLPPSERGDPASDS